MCLPFSSQQDAKSDTLVASIRLADLKQVAEKLYVESCNHVGLDMPTPNLLIGHIANNLKPKSFGFSLVWILKNGFSV